MDFELLFNPAKVEGHPWQLFFVGTVYTLIAVFLASLLFKNYASIIMVSITVVAALPLVYRIIKFEASKDKVIRREYQLLKEHEKAISVFIFLFLGFVAGYLIWFLFMSPEQAQTIFSAQIDTIMAINAPVGAFISKTSTMWQIFANNLRILAICTAFSFIFGSGALLILSWNASVMATAIGSFVRNKIGGGVFTAISVGLGRYLLHGIPEIIAYLIGGLAGGIMFHALLRRWCDRHTVLDVAILLSVALGLLGIGAAIEVYLTPIVFG